MLKCMLIVAAGIHAVSGNKLLQQGSQLQRDGRLDEAIHTFKSAAAAEPAAAEPQYWLAQALLRAGRQAEGESHFRASIKVAPAHAASHYSLALLLQRNRRLPEATAAYEAVVKVEPTHTDALTNLGICLKNQGRLADALTSYEQAAKLAPQDADIFTNMGVAQQATGRFEKAVESYKMATTIQPRNFNAYFNLGIELKRLSRIGEAVDAYARYADVISIMDATPCYQFKLSYLSLPSALDISPNYPNALHNVGTLLKPFSQRSHPELPDGVSCLWAAKNAFIGYVNSRRGGGGANGQCQLRLVYEWDTDTEGASKLETKVETMAVLADGEGKSYGSDRPLGSIRSAVAAAKRAVTAGGGDSEFPLAAARDREEGAMRGAGKVQDGGVVGGHGYLEGVEGTEGAAMENREGHMQEGGMGGHGGSGGGRDRYESIRTMPIHSYIRYSYTMHILIYYTHTLYPHTIPTH
jgi:tetratricopeptide (TPR) repeat protein